MCKLWSSCKVCKVVRSHSCERVQQRHCYHSFQFHSQPREKFYSLLSAPTEFQFTINHVVHRDAFFITEPNGGEILEVQKGSALLTTGSVDERVFKMAFITKPPLGVVPSCRALSGFCRPPYRSWIFLLRLRSECRSNRQPPLSLTPCPPLLTAVLLKAPVRESFHAKLILR